MGPLGRYDNTNGLEKSLKYQESKEQSAELLRKVLALLGQHDAAYNPLSYSVWYEFVAGINPGLSKAVELALKSEPRFSDATMLRLYLDHVADADPASMQRISGELQNLMNGMAASASRTGGQAGAFGEQLKGLSQALDSGDSLAMASLLAQTLTGTATMQSSAQELEQQVASDRREIDKLRADLVRARDEVVQDPLTGILNRKGFDRQMKALLDHAPAPERLHCMIMLDIDHFKKVNDTYGHVMGDRVIQGLGEVLRTSVNNEAHSAARYGGEEFAILLPDCTLAESMKLAETVLQRTRAMRVRDRRTNEVVLKITISGGVAALQSKDDAQTFIARADGALYQSKQGGRDRVTCA